MDTNFSSNTNSSDSGGMLGKAGDAANAGAHTRIDKVSDVARTTVDSLAAGAHQGYDKASDAASRAAETFDAKREELKIAQAKLMESCRGYIRQNPVASMGIATAIGYVLSRLLKR